MHLKPLKRDVWKQFGIITGKQKNNLLIKSGSIIPVITLK